MMTMPGALVTGLVIAILIRQMSMFTGAVADMALPSDRAPLCYDVPQKLSVGKNTSDGYRARQMQQLQSRLYKNYTNLMELGTLCQKGNCTRSELRELHKVFRSYVQSRALNFKYSEAYFGPSGRTFFRELYETREEALLRELGVELHRSGILDLRKMDGYESAARVFMYSPPEEFRHCK